MYNILSLLVGAVVSIMILCNGTLANSFAPYTTILIIHLVGFVLVLAICIVTKAKLKLTKDIPLYLYSAGAIGVFTVLFNNIGYQNLGLALPLALGLLGQTMASIIIDHFGLMGMKKIRFESKKFIGLAFIIVGIGLMTFI